MSDPIADLPTELQDMIATAISRMPSESAAVQCEQGRWRLRDGALLHIETAEDAILAVLSMPETHPDLHQLEQLLKLCGQDWPAPLSASLNADETQALLFVRLNPDGLDIDRISQAILVLLQARGRWLRSGAAR